MILITSGDDVCLVYDFAGGEVGLQQLRNQEVESVFVVDGEDGLHLP